MFDCAVSEQIHQGLRSRVYRAQRNSDGSPVIIKVPQPGRSRAERVRGLQGELASFQRLAGAQGVAEPYGLAWDGDDVALIVADQGGTSARRLGLAGVIEIERFLDIALRLVDVLEGVHARGVIHRDLNPDHIVLDAALQHVELIGFSRSLLIDDAYTPNGSGAAASGIVGASIPAAALGEATYTSPEQTGRLKRSVDFRSDYYLLGLTLFELLTGAPPFQSSDPLKLVHAHLARSAPDPRALRAGVPASMSQILLQLLAKDADDRYQTTRALRRDLLRCRSERAESSAVPRSVAPSGTAPESAVPPSAAPARFRLPERLYGRERAAVQLAEALQQATQGRATVVTVMGGAGVGKSALLEQLLESVPAQRGHILRGRFEPLHGPYAGLREALESLVVSARTRERLTQAWAGQSPLDAHAARVLVQFCPALQSVLGPQASLASLPPQQAGSRLSRSVGVFLRAVLDQSAPLCVFLDDLQWAGEDSLRLLGELLRGDLRGPLLILLSLRPAAEGESSPLRVLEGLPAQVDVRSLELSNLAEADIAALLRDALAVPPEVQRELTRIIAARTHGNPYFVRSFLTSLQEDGVIERGASGWEVDLAQVEQRRVTDNVVDLLLRRIEGLPEGTQRLLEHAALLGSRFELQQLCCVAGEELAGPGAAALLPAVEAELLQELDAEAGGAAHLRRWFQFAHDRVQQAVLGTIPEAQRVQLHLDVGRSLLAQHELLAQRGEWQSGEPPRGADSSALLFDIVRHLNQALALQPTSAERSRLAALNQQACQRALGEGAGAVALQLAQRGCAALGDEGWSFDYERTRDLHQLAAEAAFAWADHEAFEAIAARVLAHARGSLDAVAILRLRGRVYQAQSRPQQAIATYLHALETLGAPLPAELNEAVLQQAEAETAALLARHDPGSLLRLPECTDPAIVAAMELLSKLVFFAYASASPLLPLAACRLVCLSIRHGNTAESANGYTFYGRMLGGRQQYEAASRYGQLALDLAHRFADPLMLSQTYLYANYELMHWQSPHGELIASFEKAVEYGLQAGSPVNSACSAATLSICRLWAGDPLPQLGRDMAAQRPLMEQFRQRLILQWHDALAQAVQNLRGDARDPTLLQGDIYDERERLPKNASSASALFNFYVWKTLLCYLFDDVPGALASSERNEPFKPTFAPALWAIPLTYLDCLCELAGAARLLGAAPPADDLAAPRETRAAELLERARAHCAQLEGWLAHNPGVKPRWYTVRAQLAQLEGRSEQAHQLFQAALTLADSNPILFERGITYELAGRFSASVGDRVGARARLRAAHRAYFRWGALAKVRAMEQRYPDLLPQTFPGSIGAEQGERTGADPRRDDTQELDPLDLLTLLSSSRSISGEIRRDALFAKLTAALIENAGAVLGYLLRKQGESWVVEAGQSAEAGAFALLQSIPMEELSARGLPGVATSVVSHVATSGETVLLDDACSSSFRRDEHVSRQQTVSVLCFPMRRANEIAAIVYLENDLARGAFTRSSLAMLQMLSTQALISLENTTLYESLEQKVEERTRQLRQKNSELASALERIVEVQRQMVNQEKLAELGALAAGIAHEIKNPLNFVTNFADVANGLAEEIVEIAESASGKSPELDELVSSFQQATGKIREHGKRATGIIDGMALHARAGEGRHELVDLNYILGQSVMLAAHGTRAGGLEIEVVTDYDQRLEPVELVIQDISRVVVNLLSNARYAVGQKHRRGVRYTPRISVSSRDLGAQVELRVRDNGVGVPAAIRERLFVPFFTTKPTGEGTGLGLSITHDIIVRGHGGQIRVESEEGEFTEFVVLLPKRQRKSGPLPSAGATPGLAAQPGAQNETSRMPRRI